MQLDTCIQLPKFLGKINGDIVESWLRSLSTYFRACLYMDEDRKFHIASLQLEGIAQTWWGTQLENLSIVIDLVDNTVDGPQVITSWDGFFRDTKTIFTSLHIAKICSPNGYNSVNFRESTSRHTSTSCTSSTFNFMYQI